jgi:hypothetical protein
LSRRSGGEVIYRLSNGWALHLWRMKRQRWAHSHLIIIARAGRRWFLTWNGERRRVWGS